MVRSTLFTEQTLIVLTLGAALMSTGCTGPSKTGRLDLNEYRSALEQTEQIERIAPDSATERSALKRFEEFYAVYSQDAIRDGVRDLYADDAWFGDPFHQVRGIDAIEHYFLVMAEPVEECTFIVDDIQRSGKDYYARWTMNLTSKAAPREPIEAIGLSHVRFNADGKIVFQQDYWDTSALLDRLPVVGFWTRFAKGRLEKRFGKQP